jgi:hypothetical protein
LEVKISFLKRATYSASITSVVFWLLFQLSKVRVIQSAAPFAEDPYDAIASFAFQIALVVSLLSLARLISIEDENGLHQRAPFILRGILLAELCILATLAAYLVAIIQVLPLTISTAMIFILVGLAFLSALFTVTGVFWFNARKEIANLPAHLTPDALGQTTHDCWKLVTVIARWVVTRIPILKPVWNWVDSLAGGLATAWNKRLPFANPNQHPWGFAMTFAVLIGIAVMGIIMLSESLLEGGPENIAIAFLLAGIFFVGETVAVLISFLLFGGYLGLRPKI